ncbi:MAG: hypothetical protein BWY02_02084 [bacterium ADurb.Bin157]|nr:MAG: hypothetical protein BWY02_02084 [bacterium ADurb.Bin157]
MSKYAPSPALLSFMPSPLRSSTSGSATCAVTSSTRNEEDSVCERNCAAEAFILGGTCTAASTLVVEVKTLEIAAKKALLKD